MMNKARIESLSDCVFSIVMTLLVLDIKVPSLADPFNGYELMGKLWQLWPSFRSFYISFAVLGMYWIAHHALFHMFAKQANRPVTYLNMLFLALICLIPFSANLIGKYPLNEIAIAVYGANVIVIGLVQYIMFKVTVNDPQIVHEHVTPRLIAQAKVRMLLPPGFAVAGIVFGFINPSISFFLFAFPIVFNIIPGTLNALESLFNKSS